MKTLIIATTLTILSLTSGVVARHAWTRPIPLYTQQQTWAGGRVTVSVQYDPKLGLQKRIINITQGDNAH